MQKGMNLIAQIQPQVVRQALFTVLTITTAIATGGIHRFVHRINHVGDIDLITATTQAITTTRTAHTGNQAATA